MTTTRSVVVALVVAALLGACTSEEESGGDESPATLTAVEGTDRFQVSLTEGAEQRLGVETDQVRAVAAASADVNSLVTATIPYAAVVYDSQGAAWTYVSPGPHTFVRAEITVDRIEDDIAMLTAGPPVGTKVVVVGVSELLGAEMQIAGEE
jgi:hypothetical protein